jgi:hypothetical protein
MFTYKVGQQKFQNDSSPMPDLPNLFTHIP